MVILSIDQATTSGYCVVNGQVGKVLKSGVWKLADKNRSGESRGMRYLRFRKNIEDIFDEFPDIGLLVHEQTLLRGGAATEIANGLKAIMLEIAEIYGIEVSCVHTSELKKFATGNGGADKQAMIDACFLHTGIAPVDDNEADAVLIGLWASSKYGGFKLDFGGVGIEVSKREGIKRAKKGKEMF